VRAATRKGRVVVLVGPPGIGKSTVLAAWARTSEPVIARCLPAFSQMAYRPLAHALGQPLVGASDEVATDVVAALDGRVLAVEDVHWADPSTLDVLRELIERVPMVLTSRSGQPLGGDSRVDEIVVPALDDDEAAALVRRLHPDLTDAKRRDLLESAAGNPLLIAHLVRGTELSASVRDAVAVRIADLPASVVDELGRLALLGDAPMAGDLAASMRASASGLVEVDEERRTRFTHELFAVAVQDVLGEERLDRLRRELVPQLPPAVACRHLLALGEQGEAARMAREAAAEADPTERADLLAVAVEALGASAPADLLLEAAAAANHAHRPDAARRFARMIGPDGPTGIHAQLQLARAVWLDGDPGAAEEILERALTRVTGSGSAIEASLVVERAFVAVRRRVGDPGILRLADDAVEVASRSGSGRARALNTAGLARSHTGQPGWREMFDAAYAAAVEEDDHEEQLAANYWLISALGFYGPMLEAIELGAGMVDETARLRARRWYHHFLGAHVVHLSSRGAVATDRMAEAHQMLREAPRFRNRAQVELALVAAHLDHGDLDECDRILAAGDGAARGREDVALLACARCEIALARRDVDGMSRALQTIVDSGAAFFGLNAIAESAAINLAFGAPGRLDPPATVTRLTPVLDVVQLEREAHDRQLAGDIDGAIRMCRVAAEQWDERGLYRFARRSRLAQLEIALAADDVDRADRLLGVIASEPDDVSSRRREDLAREIGRRRVRAGVTSRELEILDLVGSGLTSRQIAAQLGISSATVDSHVDAAMRRLGARTRVHAASLVR
jgi:DNA-binding CsgD family transcriptional regulator/energy-coupling factor transporter ATP-binding protein EcfA2